MADALRQLSELVGLPRTLELRTVEDMGRGVFAKSPLPVGTQVLTCLPVAHCTSIEDRGNVCESCLQSAENLRRCSRCKFVYYCSTSCQRDDWLSHKGECEAVRSVTPEQPTPLMRLVCRVISVTQGNEWAVDQLCSAPFLKGDKVDEMAFMTALTRLTSQPPQTLHLILRKLTCNTFSVPSSDLSEVGVALYAAASLLNHSCQPNTVAVFSGTRLSLRTVRPVFLGEQLFISYIETFQLRSERQAELQSQYHFTCGCERCDADESKCPGSTDRQLLMDAHGEECSRQELDRLLEEVKQLKTSKSTELSSRAELLYDTHSSSLGSANILLIRLADMLFHSSLQSEKWVKALHYNSLLVQPYLDHYGAHHPVTVLTLLRSGKLRRLFGSTEQLQLSVQDLTKARDAALVVFGGEHVLTREATEMLCDSQLELSSRLH